MATLDDLNSRLQAASHFLSRGEYIAAEREIDSVARAVFSTGRVLLPPHEVAKLQGLRGRCYVALGLYDDALPLIEGAIEARKRAGIVDASYFDLLLDRAAALRGQCRSADSIAVIAEIRELSRVWPAGLAERISTFEKQADAIRQNRSWGLQIRPGRGLGEPLGSSDIYLKPALRNLTARVLRLAARPIDRYRLKIDLEFMVDNTALIDLWPGEQLPVESRPLLFAFFLPRGAVVSSDGFSIQLNDPDPAWETSFFFADNGYHTVFLPESYHRYGPRPLPSCKSYKYVQGQSITFHGRLPPQARVSFSGIVDYAPNGAFRQSDKGFPLHIMLPFGGAVVDPKDVMLSPEQPFRLARTRFRDERAPPFIPERNEAIVMDMTTPDLPRVGREEAFLTVEMTEKAPLHLMLGDLLSVGVPRPNASSLAIAVKPTFAMIPTGFASFVETTDAHVNDDETVSLVSRSSKLPLVRCIAENNGSSLRHLSLQVTCAELGVLTTKKITVNPGDRLSVPIEASLPEPVPAFARISEQEDEVLAPSTVAVTVVVTDNEMSTTYSFDAHALPPDYAIWGVTNGRSGGYEDFRPMIARWVTPDDPLVRSFLDRFVPQGPTSAEADLRLIYAGLCGLRFEYDNSRLVFGARMSHHYQRVRFPAVSLRHRRINCIDATVLLASLLEAAGHEAAVTFVPGHAYLCLIVDSAAGNLIALESTGLCGHWRVNDEAANRALTFDEAAHFGRQTTERCAERLFGKKVANGDAPVTVVSESEFVGMPPYRFLRISALRGSGITPFRSG